MKKEDILARAKRFREFAVEADRHNREEMLDDLRFASLDQWPDEVKKERKNRPMLTLDRTGQAVRQVTGDMQSNMPSIKVLPVDSGTDMETAEVMEGLIREIEYRSQSTHVYMNAARYQVKCGYGVFRIGTDYATHDSFDQDISILPVRNPMNWWFDPDAIQTTKHDGKFVIGLFRMSKDDFEEQYPKAVPLDWDNIYTGEDKNSWYGEDYVIIAEFYEKVAIKRETLLLSDGRTITLDEFTEEDALALEQRGLTVVKQRSVDSYDIYHHKLTAHEVLETVKLKTRYFPVIPVYGEVEDIEGKCYVRVAVWELVYDWGYV